MKLTLVGIVFFSSMYMFLLYSVNQSSVVLQRKLDIALGSLQSKLESFERRQNENLAAIRKEWSIESPNETDTTQQFELKLQELIESIESTSDKFISREQLFDELRNLVTLLDEHGQQLYENRNGISSVLSALNHPPLEKKPNLPHPMLPEEQLRRLAQHFREPQPVQLDIIEHKPNKKQSQNNNNNKEPIKIKEFNPIELDLHPKRNELPTSTPKTDKSPKTVQTQPVVANEGDFTLVTEYFSKKQFYLYNRENVAQWISNTVSERKVRAVFNLVLSNNVCQKPTNENKLILDIGANAGYYG